MKILYTLNSSTPGGMEQHVLYLVKGMISRGHDVHVWCKKGEIENWFKEAGAVVTTTEIKYDIDPLYISSLAHYLYDYNIDVCHAHELKAAVNSLLAANKVKTKVRITHTHTPISEWPSNNIKQKFVRALETKVYSYFVNKYATCEIALTKSRLQTKINEGIKSDKLRVISNCFNDKAFNVDSDTKTRYRTEIRAKFGIPEDALVFGNVSRLSEEKNHKLLIEAFADAQFSQNKKAYLLIAGGGKLEKPLRDLVSSKASKDNIVITGIFPQNELAKYYFASDVFIFPSKAEGFGLVLIEALGAGLPVIASDIEVLKEVAGNTADYFSLGAKESLTKMINGYIKYFDTHTNVPVNTAGIDLVNKLYTEEIFITAYEDLYKRNLEKL